MRSSPPSPDGGHMRSSSHRRQNGGPSPAVGRRQTVDKRINSYGIRRSRSPRLAAWYLCRIHRLAAVATFNSKSFPIMQPNRRQIIRSLAGSGLLLPGLISELAAGDNTAAQSQAHSQAADPLAPKQPHFAAKAKRVIFLFMTGGVSHIDTFDPSRYSPRVMTRIYKPNLYYKGSVWKYKRYGQAEQRSAICSRISAASWMKLA